MTTKIGLYFWPPVAGDRFPVAISPDTLFASLSYACVHAKLVDAEEFCDWCDHNDLAIRFDGDYHAIPFPDDAIRDHFKLRWW